MLLSTTSSGRAGPGGVLSHFHRQQQFQNFYDLFIKAILLSPGCHSSAGQNRELSGVNISSIRIDPPDRQLDQTQTWYQSMMPRLAA